MTAWSAYIEYAMRDFLRGSLEELHDRLIDLLENWSVATTTAPNGNLGIFVTLDEPTVERAISSALELTGGALRKTYGSAQVVGVEVITTEEQDRRNSEPSIPELAGRAQVAEILDVSPQRADQIMRTKRFQQHVQPVTLLGERPLFVASHLRAFAEIRNSSTGR
ncbi:hypothetical protein ACFC60_22180 [Kitasatospora purpeofusca]|uniref:hypothetical protein n=1 Tax=Kitasatospora purpeofusca TaxID=67352 RepID=UPI0035E1D200